MPTTTELCCCVRSYRKPKRHPRRAQGRQRPEALQRTEGWIYGRWPHGRNRNVESFLERCSHIFSFRAHPHKWFHEHYDKGIAAASDRMAANLPSAEVLTLEHMADTGKAQEFERLARAMNWSEHRPSHLARVIDVALSLDMISLARELAERGNAIFPDNIRLNQAVAVLSPGVAVETMPTQPLKVDVSQKWLKEHGPEYKGQWVAVRNGALLGTAPTLKQLHQQIGQEGKTAQTIIVKVLSED